MVRRAYSQRSLVEVLLPDGDKLLLGAARMPAAVRAPHPHELILPHRANGPA